jgi:hypothetical protein
MKFLAFVFLENTIVIRNSTKGIFAKIVQMDNLNIQPQILQEEIRKIFNAEIVQKELNVLEDRIHFKLKKGIGQI